MKDTTGTRSQAFLLVLVVLVVIVSSCELDSETAATGSDTIEHPDMVLFDADYVLGLAGSQPILIHAATIEIHGARQQAVLSEVTFEQYGSDGLVSFSGTARTMAVDTDTNDATLTGDIVVTNHRADVEIKADSLSWSHEHRLLTGPADGTVVLDHGGRYHLTGTGFSGDFGNAIYEFATIGQGEVRDAQ